MRKNLIKKSIVHAALLAIGLASAVNSSRAADPAMAIPQLHLAAAEHIPAANSATMLAAARIDTRIIAVGDHGVILLSDNDGKTYRQAQQVPVNSTLNSVFFIDKNSGWAVGHWGVILQTIDGGETWALQRSDISVDQPLFGVYFKDAREGWAVGLWSLILHTENGGATWSVVTLPSQGNKKADRSLYSVFSNAHGDLFIACEQGRIMRSTDQGKSWIFVDTGYAGSFWSGIALRDGTLIVGGLRGSLYRSADNGSTWQAVTNSSHGSITGITETNDQVIATGLDGNALISHDSGKNFTAEPFNDSPPLTAVTDTTDGRPIFFSSRGPVVK